MKKLLLLFITACALFLLGGCGQKVLHCDHCNAEVSVKKSSNMTEEWIIYCDKCNEELFGDDPLLNGEK
jgi:hypothetical protein